MNTTNDHFMKTRELFAQNTQINEVKSQDSLYILYILRVVNYNLEMTAVFLVQSFKKS